MATFLCSRCYRVTVGYLCNCPVEGPRIEMPPPTRIDGQPLVAGERILIRPGTSRWERFKCLLRRLFRRNRLKQKQNGIYTVSVDSWDRNDDKLGD